MTRGRVLEQTFLRTRFLHGLSENGAEAWSDHRLHPERFSRGQEAIHLIAAPRHRDSSRRATGALQADTAHVLVPADGKSITVIAIDNHMAGEIQGQRLDSSSRLITLLGVKQICIPTDVSVKAAQECSAPDTQTNDGSHLREQDGIRHRGP